MITKEYRIPMPLDVDEYKIAQLYMIAKKSRLESEKNSGVEIITNEPYSDGPGGNGQYTNKLYHIAARLPVWLRGFLPKSLATVREYAWNAYPYSKNFFFTPNMDRFTIEIESKYLRGGSEQENVFELDDEQLSNRQVDVVDFVNDPSGADNCEEEDPLKYCSEKTKRGPLTRGWLESLPSADSDHAVMCVYKICRVNFERWPIQYRVESFIHDQLRKNLVQAHRQAWAWQDEWHGLTMSQVRDMETETQKILAEKMRSAEEIPG